MVESLACETMHWHTEMFESLARETPDFIHPKLLWAATVNSFSSGNQIKFIVEAGSITATGGTN